jgi:cell division protein FtsZ
MPSITCTALVWKVSILLSAIPTRKPCKIAVCLHVFSWGPSLTQGLGAGANPEIGQKACHESIEEIKKLLESNTKMVFVTAGMGGGTGTGGAPVVAKIAKELGILTVGIVTTPFSYEGSKRRRQAEEGINRMREHVDTILVISNDKLRHLFGNIPTSQAFCKADDILATATKCITDVINSQGHIVVDFADVSTVMRDGGVAILGSATASGEKRAYEAVEKAINSPLLNDDNIRGAKWVLLNINSARGVYEHTLDEVEMIQAYVQEQAGEECDVIFGTGFDDNLGENISVTVIATGFQYNQLASAYSAEKKTPIMDSIKEVYTLQPETPAEPALKIEVNDDTHLPKAVVLETETPVDPMAPVMFEIEPPAIPARLAIGLGLQSMRVNHVADVTTTVQEEPRIVMELQAEPEPVVEQATPHTEQPLVVEFEMKEESTQSPTASIQEELNQIFSAPIEMVEKTEEEMKDEFVTIKGITLNRRKGNRMLTDMELEDQANFEIQKRAFDDRASKLRSMSFNVNRADIDNEQSNVPAYIRKNLTLEDHPSSNEEVYSNVKITGDGQQSNISTINTFLNGKNPD